MDGEKVVTQADITAALANLKTLNLTAMQAQAANVRAQQNLAVARAEIEVLRAQLQMQTES